MKEYHKIDTIFKRGDRKKIIVGRGNFDAEGIVAKPEVELVKRNGDRIITKLKHKDFAS